MSPMLVTTPGTRAYHPLFGPLIVGELVLNAVLLLWVLGLLYLFFAKGRSFPVAMITFMILRVVGQVAGLGVAIMIPATAVRIGPVAYGALAGSVLVAAIWVPSLVKPRRVGAAFVRRPPARTWWASWRGGAGRWCRGSPTCRGTG